MERPGDAGPFCFGGVLAGITVLHGQGRSRCLGACLSIISVAGGQRAPTNAKGNADTRSLSPRRFGGRRLAPVVRIPDWYYLVPPVVPLPVVPPPIAPPVVPPVPPVAGGVVEEGGVAGAVVAGALELAGAALSSFLSQAANETASTEARIRVLVSIRESPL
jgi:hypothetical protein